MQNIPGTPIHTDAQVNKVAATGNSTEYDADYHNLHAMINSTGDLMWSVDRNYRLMACNTAFNDLMKLLSGTSIQKGDSVLSSGFNEEQLSKYKQYYDCAFAGQSFTELEYSAEPYEIWNEISFYPISKEGIVTGAACQAHDISQRKRAEREAKDSEYKFRSLVENSGEAVAVLAADGRMIYVSDSATNILGYTKSELLALDLNSIIHPDSRPVRSELMKKTLASPGVPIMGFEKKMWHKSGRWIWIECTLTNMLHDPAIYGIIDNFRDITEKKLAAKNISHLNKLYAFTSQLNKTIVRANSEQTLFKDACRIAVELGDFTTAWIGTINEAEKKISLVAEYGMEESDKPLFMQVGYEKDGAVNTVLRTGTYCLYNDVDADVDDISAWKAFGKTRQWLSYISIPIRTAGKITATLNLAAAETNYFNPEMISQLNEAADDISFALDIQEQERMRRLAEEKLATNEHRFRSLVEHSTGGIIILSEDRKRKYISASITNILGYTPDEFMALTVAEVVHPDDLPLFSSKFNESLATPRQPVTGCRGRRKHKDGTWRWLEYTFTNMLQDPVVNGVINNFRDITEELEASEKLAHSEVRLKQAQEIAKIGSWQYNLVTGVIVWSEEVCRIYGLPLSENTHTIESWSAFIHNDDKEAVQKQIEEARATFSNASIYYRMVRNDGTIRHIHLLTQYELNDDGPPRGVYGSLQDVTEQKLAEEKLIRFNHLYAFTNEINQSIIHAHNEQILFRTACKAAVNRGKFGVAWISKLDDNNQKLTLIDHCGIAEADVTLFSSVSTHKKNILTEAVTTGSYCLNNDFEHSPASARWSTIAIERNWQSTISLPIKRNGKVIATFNLCAGTPGYFQTEEIVTLEEATSAISMALDVIDKERMRAAAEENFLNERIRLKHAQAIAHLGSWEIDMTTSVGIWSDEACRIHGIPIADNLQSYGSWLSFIHPDDVDYVVNTTKAANERGKEMNFYHRIVRPDGTIRHLHAQAQAEFNEHGEPIRLYGIAHDITDEKNNIISLRAQNEQLKEIAWIQSHKVRGPLATILGLAELFKSKYHDNTEEIIDGILLTSEKLDLVIREIVNKTATYPVNDSHNITGS